MTSVYSVPVAAVIKVASLGRAAVYTEALNVEAGFGAFTSVVAYVSIVRSYPLHTLAGTVPLWVVLPCTYIAFFDAPALVSESITCLPMLAAAPTLVPGLPEASVEVEVKVYVHVPITCVLTFYRLKVAALVVAPVSSFLVPVDGLPSMLIAVAAVRASPVL